MLCRTWPCCTFMYIVCIHHALYRKAVVIFTHLKILLLNHLGGQNVSLIGSDLGNVGLLDVMDIHT